MTTQQIIEALREVECELSPENLTCDGELPRGQVRAKLTRLTKKRAGLIKALGREPSFDEIWGRI